MEKSPYEESVKLADPANSPSNDKTAEQSTQAFHKSWRFWSSFVALCLLSFISALDVTVIATALPTITQEIGGQHQYVWIASSFILASTAPQPLFGQIANLFGRRDPVVAAILLFALGSGIAGGAHDPAMLIAGRAIQGVGAGGIYALIDIIICDIVPLRQRGQYLGILFSFAGVGATIGPVIGGALAEADWRWIFYLNLPICAVALLVVLLCLRFKQIPRSGFLETLSRIDLFGSALFIAAMLSLLFGLITGGVQYSWQSWRVILPIVLGVVGWAAFHLYQASRWCKEPSLPPRLFTNRTSMTGFILAGLSNVSLQAVAYFLPIYFQAVKGMSAARSGVSYLPFAVTILFWAVLAGFLFSKSGKYRWLHCTSFALSAVSMGLFTLLNGNSSKAAWACFQVVAAAGFGSIQAILLPSILAALAEADVATASATYAFCRSFGQIWGVTLASVTFNASVNSLLRTVSDLGVRSQLADGQAYSNASEQYVARLPQPVRTEVISVYVKSLNAVWYLVIGLCGLSFLLVALEKEIPLRKELETEYGLDETKATQDCETNSVIESSPPSAN